MEIRIDLSQLKTIPRDLQVGSFRLVGNVRDAAVKAIRTTFKSQRFEHLFQGTPVVGALETQWIHATVEALPVPAIPARTATAHYTSGRTKQVTIDATEETNVIAILSAGRPTVFPVRKRILTIGIKNETPAEGYLTVPGINVNGFDVPGQNMILRPSSRAVAAKPFIQQAVDMVNNQMPELVDISFADMTVR